MDKLTKTKEIRELCNSIKKKALKLNGKSIPTCYKSYLIENKLRLESINDKMDIILQKGVRNVDS